MEKEFIFKTFLSKLYGVLNVTLKFKMTYN